jgi:hypothetical protein
MKKGIREGEREVGGDGVCGLINHVSAEAPTTGWMIPRTLIVHHQR